MPKNNHQPSSNRHWMSRFWLLNNKRSQNSIEKGRKCTRRIWSILSCQNAWKLPESSVNRTQKPTRRYSYFLCSCSVAQSCPTLCHPMDCSMLGFHVLHCLLEFVKTHVHWINDAIQPSHPVAAFLLLPSIFSSESALDIRWPEYWSFSVSPSNEYSGMISFRIDWFDLLVVQGTLKGLFQHHSSKASIL